MIKKVLFGLLAIVVLLLLAGALLSTHYAASRSVVIHAAPEKIFPLFGDLANWPRWDPFAAADPTARITLGEKSSGVGATRSWSGDQNKGKLTFTLWDPKTGIDYDLEFTNGERTSPARSSMHMNARSDGAVELVWSISGEMNMPLLGGYFALFADRFIGPEFERGLAQLKAVAEGGAPPTK